MRHRKTNATLDRNSAQRQRLIRNLALSLVTHGKIVTTRARARVVRSYVEKLITTGKQKDLAHRRQILRYLPNARAAEKILSELSPKFLERRGGYTRVVKMNRRAGDGAEQVVIEFVA